MQKKQWILAAALFAFAAPLPTAAFAGCEYCEDTGKMMDNMKKELNLSDDQADRIKAIKEAKKEKVDAAKKEAREQIKAVLNPDQQSRFDKMMERKEEKEKAHHKQHSK
jgi:hypothetical protein